MVRALMWTAVLINKVRMRVLYEPNVISLTQENYCPGDIWEGADQILFSYGVFFPSNFQFKCAAIMSPTHLVRLTDSIQHGREAARSM